MIVLKTAEDFKGMRAAGIIAAKALELGGSLVRPGISTLEIDRQIQKYIEAQGASAPCLGYHGFPCATCISVNNAVIHGIPSAKQLLKEGDIVDIDVVVLYKGYHGDTAATFPRGKVSEEAERLMRVTREARDLGILQAKAGNRVGDIAHAIQAHCEAAGFSMVREYTGHGVGFEMHEDPSIPNYGPAGRGMRLVAGMTVAIEPMVNLGGKEIRLLSDGWTAVTKDGSLSAHFEHSVGITDSDPVIFTAV